MLLEHQAEAEPQRQRRAAAELMLPAAARLHRLEAEVRVGHLRVLLGPRPGSWPQRCADRQWQLLLRRRQRGVLQPLAKGRGRSHRLLVRCCAPLCCLRRWLCCRLAVTAVVPWDRSAIL